MHSEKERLIQRFAARDAHVAIIGMGYVGLPLAVAFAEAGYRVTGIDVNEHKIESINRGESYVGDVSDTVLQTLTSKGVLRATNDYATLAGCDAVSVCVPTPLNKTGEPDLSFVANATAAISKHLHSGMAIILESTTFPGTTTDVVLPQLTSDNDHLRIGEDFFLAFSPERIDPGQEEWTIENMPKLIGGVTPACLEVVRTLYEAINHHMVPVSSPEVAEMAKLLENTFRTVNIGLANEFLLMCDRLGLDVWEVIDAASTKPFGFMRFTPGPGLGGHCLPVDPHYLSWKLRSLKYKARFIELASEINAEMPVYWVQQVQHRLNEVGKPLKGTRILVLGVAYKKNVGDLRESPALDIIHLLRSQDADVRYHDPHVPAIDVEGLSMKRAPDLNDALVWADCIVVATDHDAYEWATIASSTEVFVDTRHVI